MEVIYVPFYFWNLYSFTENLNTKNDSDISYLFDIVLVIGGTKDCTQRLTLRITLLPGNICKSKEPYR
jgi:hypothetical protein